MGNYCSKNGIEFSNTALGTKNATMTACKAPIRSRVKLGRVVNIALGCVSALFVAIRIGYKVIVSRAELGWDDYFIVITLVVGTPTTMVIDLGAFKHGLGLDTWTLPFDTITTFGKFFYIIEIQYFTNVAVLKLSLLFFYLRIFPARNIRRIIWTTIVFDVCFGTAFVIVAVFQCKPINYVWTKW